VSQNTQYAGDNLMSLHDFAYIFLSSFMALFPVLNPIGSAFVVNGFLDGLDEDQRKIAIMKITRNCLIIGLGSLVAGKLILLVFNLAVPVIQLAGGILICKMGLNWLSSPTGNFASDMQQEFRKVNLGKVEQQVFYPISFPICFGPGSVSVVFTLMAGASVRDELLVAVINYLLIALVIVILCGILYLSISQGNWLIHRLGSSGSLVINKLVAFFTFCIGIQIIIAGLSKIFHIHVL